MRQSLRTSDPFEERLDWAIQSSIFRGVPPDLLVCRVVSSLE
jgi:hypothetical protein